MNNTPFCDTLWKIPPGKTIRLKSFTGDRVVQHRSRQQNLHLCQVPRRRMNFASILMRSASTADRGHSLQEVTPRSHKHSREW